MDTFNYYSNPLIISRITQLTKGITVNEDKEDCKQQIWTDLYGLMPLSDKESLKIIERIAKRFKRNRHEIYENEIEYEAAGLV